MLKQYFEPRGTRLQNNLFVIIQALNWCLPRCRCSGFVFAEVKGLDAQQSVVHGRVSAKGFFCKLFLHRVCTAVHIQLQVLAHPFDYDCHWKSQAAGEERHLVAMLVQKLLFVWTVSKISMKHYGFKWNFHKAVTNLTSTTSYLLINFFAVNPNSRWLPRNLTLKQGWR